MRLRRLLAVLVLSGAALPACAQGPAVDDPPTDLVIAAGEASGVYYRYGQGLAEALSAEGYVASASTTRTGGQQLCQHHCPVAHVAAEFPQLCEAETEAFAQVLGAPVQRLATIANGDGVCTTHVSSLALAARRARTHPSSTSTS